MQDREENRFVYKCKNKLTTLVGSWKDTPVNEEETLFQKLKITAKEEKILRTIESRRNPEDNKNLKQKRNLENLTPEEIENLET